MKQTKCMDSLLMLLDSPIRTFLPTCPPATLVHTVLGPMAKDPIPTIDPGYTPVCRQNPLANASNIYYCQPMPVSTWPCHFTGA
jgi:hypothetical protein